MGACAVPLASAPTAARNIEGRDRSVYLAVWSSLLGALPHWHDIRCSSRGYAQMKDAHEAMESSNVIHYYHTACLNEETDGQSRRMQYA